MTDDDKIELLASEVDGARWCMIGGAGQIAPLFNPLPYDWPRARETLRLAQRGYVVKSRSRPSLGIRLLASELLPRQAEFLGMDPAYQDDPSVFVVERGAVHQYDQVVLEPTTTEKP